MVYALAAVVLLRCSAEYLVFQLVDHVPALRKMLHFVEELQIYLMLVKADWVGIAVEHELFCVVL